jgi:hypothetical protein
MRRIPDKTVFSRDSWLRNPYKIPQCSRPAYSLMVFYAGKTFGIFIVPLEGAAFRRKVK